MPSWFDVSTEGLGKLLEGRSRTFVLAELLGNVLDTDAKTCVINLTPASKRGYADLEVIDDHPTGFQRLSDAWTLFAPSIRGNDSGKRGRFNLGEKLCLALCEWAEIETTTGTVTFDKAGRTYDKKRKTETGSRFRALIKMNKPDLEEIGKWIFTVIVPKTILVTYNGESLPYRDSAKVFEEQLPTVLADEEGNLRPTVRKTEVRVYETLPGEEAMLYEMGIPVVATNDTWHVDVQQKIPLNSDRDNVTPSYLRKIRTAVMNEMYREIGVEDANKTWSKEALGSPDIAPEAVTAIVEKRFGDKVVAFDPSDTEANKIAVQQGFTVVHGRSLSKEEWGNIKQTGAILPAGQVTPSPKVTVNGINFADLGNEGSDGTLIPREQWTPGMWNVVGYAEIFMKQLLDKDVNVEIRRTSIGDRWLAAYGGSTLMFNLMMLGHKFFDKPDQLEVDALLIHEAAHDRVLDHLGAEFYTECCRLGALARTCSPFLYDEED